ncbi:hypothetical protein ASC97_32295 [Rhizobium sp. Root1203]|uniref:hypothetical protein n=1 Tax=Rhizobium sp. Root1203 TaxID=1736427 RepID=UPI00070BF955|nr:hypothetical protein [Rhizobium sp. Root1203]KQV12510.1 hypothetical protein ASC97_32295 [Rhizobium sp. Root1203]
MQLSKREFFQVGGLAMVPSLLALPAYAQSEGTALAAPTTASVQSVHSELVASARNETPGHDPWAADALKGVIVILLETKVITEPESQFLNRLVEALITSENLEILARAVRTLIAEAEQELTQLAKNVGAIVQSSLESAGNILKDVDWEIVRGVILRDARGTLDGARMGYRLYGVPGAVIGAAIGGGATSMPAFAAVPAA